jgi:hypothetical protein
MEKQPSQKDTALALLLDGVHLTPMDALNGFGCLRLAARVAELRAEGWTIKSRDYRTASGKIVAQYRIDPEDRSRP